MDSQTQVGFDEWMGQTTSLSDKTIRKYFSAIKGSLTTRCLEYGIVKKNLLLINDADLFDEDNDETCRSFWFSVGPCQTVIVIAPTWEIRFFKPLKTHKAINKYDLLTQVSNCIIELLHSCYLEAAAETAASTAVKK